MRILFVHAGQESLGIEYLSSVLKNRGHDVGLLYDPLLFRSFRLHLPFLDRGSPRKLARSAVQMDPDMVCFSVESDYFGWARRVAGEIKKIEDIPVVFGGVHPSCVPEEVLREEAIDYVCVGEGEEALGELADCLARGESASSVRNIWGKDGGVIFRNPLRDLNQDLDSLPFPDKNLFYDIFPGFVNRTYTMITSRGCHNRCAYCVHSVLRKLYEGKGPYFRRRSVENVIEELCWARERFRFKRVTFCDDIFATDIDWLVRFLKEYRRGVGLPFYCAVHPFFIDGERIDLLAAAGCSVVNFGVQTCSASLRRVIGRAGPTQKIIENLRHFRKTNIFLFTNFIFGLPGQDTRELEDIVSFCSENRADFHDVNWLRYYPGTAVIDIARRHHALDEEGVREIERSEQFRPYAHGGHSFTPERGRLRNLVFLTFFLPAPLVRFLLRHRRYRVLPSWNMRTVLVVSRLLWSKYVGGKKFPYPNWSIGDWMGYLTHFLFIRKFAVLKRLHGPGRALKRWLRHFLNMFRLAAFFEYRVLLRYGSYLAKRLIQRRSVPGVAIMALTFRCQCRCVCCYSLSFRKYFDRQAPTCPEALERRLDAVIELGVPRVHFSGGEPLLYRGLTEMVEKCASAGLLTFVETNGLLLTESFVKALRAAGTHCINISLDSCTADRHDQSRGVAGCFERVQEAIGFCARYRQRCMISTYATKENIRNGDLAGIFRLARTSGCAGVRLLPPQPAGAWAGRDDVLLDQEDLRLIDDLLPLDTLVLNRTPMITCPLRTGYKVFVLPDGRLAPCEYLFSIFKDSQDMALTDIPQRIKSCPQFSGRYGCIPRDKGFWKERNRGQPDGLSDLPLLI